MRDEREIRSKYKDLRYRYLKRYLREHLGARPSNCVHNHKHEKEGGTVRLCMLGAEDVENWPGNICDTVENAKTCPFFKARTDKDKEHIKGEFDDMLQDPDVLYHEYRDLAHLLWVLDEDVPEETELSWWQNIKIWLLGSD